MRKIIILIVITAMIQPNVHAQKKNIDSLDDIKRTEIIRENVQKFFKNQHKRFAYQLKGLNHEYAIYFTPTYGFRGRLDFYDNSYRKIDLLNIKDKDLMPILNYYKPTSFEKTLNVPQKVIDYYHMLLKRTSNNWCEERFGYKNLEHGSEFGILLILSPKNIPDSLSALKVNYYVPSEYETASENKKRMMDLFVKLGEYYFMGDGLKERFISVVMKY
jgi:hypothetical protein